MNISLIGFMASGKTTYAQKLAEKTKKTLVCIDDLIESNQKMSINEIFEKYGEDYFRTIEREILIEVYRNDNQIIDCGGGAAIYNQKLIKDNSYVIFIDTDFDIIWNRLINDKTRPISINKTKQELKELYDKRIDLYRKISNKTIK